MSRIVVPYSGDSSGDHVCFDLMKVLWYTFDAKSKMLKLHFIDNSQIEIYYNLDNLTELNKTWIRLSTK
jgi:hypothetical protein